MTDVGQDRADPPAPVTGAGPAPRHHIGERQELLVVSPLVPVLEHIGHADASDELVPLLAVRAHERVVLLDDLDTYTHVLPTLMRDAADAMDRALENAQGARRANPGTQPGDELDGQTPPPAPR